MPAGPGVPMRDLTRYRGRAVFMDPGHNRLGVEGELGEDDMVHSLVCQGSGLCLHVSPEVVRCDIGMTFRVSGDSDFGHAVFLQKSGSNDRERIGVGSFGLVGSPATTKTCSLAPTC